MAKLFVTFAALVFFAAAASATIVITTFSDESCTNATGFFSTTSSCSAASKRSAQGGCTPLGSTYHIYDECTAGIAAPSASPPNGWREFKYTSQNSCDFSNEYYINAIPALGSNILITSEIEGNTLSLNVTASCDDQGVLAFSTCFSLGCFEYDSVPNGVCTNITVTVADMFFNGIQTTCVAAPMAAPIAVDAPMTAPMTAPTDAPMTAPMTAPVKAPVAAPIKKSAAASVAGSALVFFAAAAMLY